MAREGPERLPGDDAPAEPGALGATREEVRTLSGSHVQLLRTHWTRLAVEWYARQCAFRHEWERGQLILRIVRSPAKHNGKPVIPQTAVPFSTGGTGVHYVPVWGLSNSKMDCPVFDLPAGPVSFGGTCPGAEMGQTTIPVPVRRAMLTAEGLLRNPPPGRPPVKLDEQKAICQSCYAEGGAFGYSDNQARMILRYWWARGMLQRPNGIEELAQLLTESIRALPFPSGAPGNILPIRLHSSGDFFSQDYASMWLRVADLLWQQGGDAQRVRFWAPTRTWAAGNWSAFWAAKLPRLLSAQDRSPNFMVRPSAYHFDDVAPEALAPGNAKGSTSMFQSRSTPNQFHANAAEKPFFDWRCPAYSVEEGAHSCSNATNPRGGRHCRACWMYPAMRINYPGH